jgi:hypothetical protein
MLIVLDCEPKRETAMNTAERFAELEAMHQYLTSQERLIRESPLSQECRKHALAVLKLKWTEYQAACQEQLDHEHRNQTQPGAQCHDNS